MEQRLAVAVSALKTLNDVINSVSNKKVIYTGEQHDQFAHHNIQLQVIKGLYLRNKSLLSEWRCFRGRFRESLTTIQQAG